MTFSGSHVVSFPWNLGGFEYIYASHHVIDATRYVCSGQVDCESNRIGNWAISRPRLWDGRANGKKKNIRLGGGKQNGRAKGPQRRQKNASMHFLGIN
jgi:hypothetical protein